MFDNRTKHQKLYEQLCAAQEDIDTAKEALSYAKEKYKSIWETYLAKPHHDDIYEKEMVIVQDGAYLYQISFDIDDFGPPRITRVDEFMKIHKVE